MGMKKREISRIGPNDPLIHTRPRFHGAPNSKFHNPKPPLTKEIGRQNKVRFAVPEVESSRRSCRLEPEDHSYMPSEKEKFTTCDPKTSEYAFFKKLKKDATLKFASGPLKKDASLSSRKPESGDCSKDRTDDVRVGSKGCNSSRINQGVSTFKTDSFLSPSVGAWNKSDLYSISNMPKNPQSCSDTCKTQGNQYVTGEIFSRKRQKLRQCVADLFPDTEKHCSKGHDIVSMLLNRLFPTTAIKNKYENPNPGKVESATRYDLLDSRESDVQFNENYQIPKRKLIELESGSYFNDQLLSPLFLRSDERITPHAEFPTYHCHNFEPLYSRTKPECKLSGVPSFGTSIKDDLTLPINKIANTTRYSSLDSGEVDIQFTEHHQIPKREVLELDTSSYGDHLLSPMLLRPLELITPQADFPIYPHKFQPLFRTKVENKFCGTPSYIGKNDVTLGFLCNEKKHETYTLDHFKELGTIEREPIPLLLENDFDCIKDEMKLPIPITCKYAKPDMAPAISILEYEEQISNNTLGEYNFSPSSLLLDKPQDFNSVLDSGLLKYQEIRFGKYFFKENEEIDTNFNHAALSLPHSKNYFKLSENDDSDTSCVQDSIYLPPFHHWLRKAVSSDYHCHADTEARLPSSLDECQRFLSFTNSCSNYQSSSSGTFKLPQRESMSSLFHVDDHYEADIDGENHGKVVYHFSKGLFEMYNSSFHHMSMQRDYGYPFSLDDSDNVNINEPEQTHEMLL